MKLMEVGGKAVRENVRTKFVGMDVHQKTISIAIADDGPGGEVRLYEKTRNTVEAIGKVIRKLVSTGAELNFFYEAGPCLPDNHLGFLYCV